MSCDSNSSFDLVLAAQLSRQTGASFSGLLQTRLLEPLQCTLRLSYFRAISSTTKSFEIRTTCDLQDPAITI